MTAGPVFLQKEKTSRAMKVYLERAREHEDFMKQQQHEFEVGKRHLANMMGEDPENFTQQDIDRAIEYLFPSGIFDPKARPLMKAPEEIFPKRKAAEFDESGRPHHSMFFTGRPNFFKLLFVSEGWEQAVNDAVVTHNISFPGHCGGDPADELLRGQNDPETIEARHSPTNVSNRIGLSPLNDPPALLFDYYSRDLSGSQWLPKAELEKVLVETIEDIEYDNFVNAMTRLSSLPYSYRVKDFIYTYRKPLIADSNSNEIPQPHYDEKGRQVVTTYGKGRMTEMSA